jgi:hypothetical protein
MGNQLSFGRAIVRVLDSVGKFIGDFEDLSAIPEVYQQFWGFISDS